MDISSTFTCRTCPAIAVLESAFLPYSEHSLLVEGAGGILKERKGLSSWIQWALVCFSLLTRCGLLGVQVPCVRGHLEYRVVLSSSHVPREALPRQPRKPGPHPVTTLLWPSCQGYCMFQALHPWQLPNSVHLPPQPYLCPDCSSQSPPGMDSMYAQRCPSSMCLLANLGFSPQRVDSHGPPCPAWTSYTPGLEHTGHSNSFGAPAQQPWLTCALEGCFLGSALCGNCVLWAWCL